MFLLVINLSRMIANIAWVSIVIIVFIILYKLLLKRLKRGRPSEENFLTLYPIEQNPASGTIQVFFEQKLPKKVKISIYNIDGSIDKTIEEKEYSAGGNVISLDTTEFENGNYYLETKTEFQKTSKLFEIKN